MLYIRFVRWLTQKVNTWEVKTTSGDAGIYNHFDDVHQYGLQPLALLVAMALTIGPFAGYLYLVMEVLPFSLEVRTWILMITLGVAWIVAAIVLLKKAKRG